MDTPTPSGQDVKLAPLSITGKLSRKAYYAKLREQWAKAKEAAIAHPESFEAIRLELERQHLNYSPMSAWFTKLEMTYLGLDGLPYVDAKTFKGWQQSGFKVRKGEKSKLHGMVWMRPRVKNQNGEWEEVDNDFVYPKVYHLFHKTQVDPLGTIPETLETPEMGHSVALNR